MTADDGVPAPSSRAGGLRAILAATLVAGVVGYALQGVVAAGIPPTDYVGFSIFWSTLYLVIAALSGLQQETTRAARPVGRGDAPGRILPFGAGVALVAGVAVVTSAPLWSGPVFGGALGLVGLLAVGAVAYAAVALLSGLFYGLGLWRGVAGMTIVDALLRFVLVGAVLALGGSPDLLAAAVVLPFPLSLGVLWLLERRRVVGSYFLDATPRALAWNALRAVGGSVSTGVLTSGYPLIIGATSRTEPQALVGALLFVVTLTRAPLVVPALALQSYLTVHFRDRREGTRGLLLRLLAAVALVSIVAAVAAYFVEPWLLRAIWGERYVVSALACGGIALTAGLTAALCISGPATLAARRHGAFLAGWAVAGAVSVAILLLPLPLEPRALLSMGAGPITGVAVHVASFLRSGARTSVTKA